MFFQASAIVFAILISSCAETGTNTSATASSPAGAHGVDYRNSKADVVVLNFFDMYCMHCQKDAKYVNKLHSMIQSRGMGSRIQIYGVGWNNTSLEAEMYRKRFHVSYPVVPDKNRSVASRFGKVRPPLLIALKKEGGVWKEFYRTHKIKGRTNKVLSQIQP